MSQVFSPLTGKAVALSEVEDPVFSEKILGDGIAVIPTQKEVLSPVGGTVVQIAETLHAVGIQGDDGVEILVHLGMDTVSLKGKGFTCLVKEGQHVSAGETIMEMDLDFIRGRGLSVTTPCIITNMDQIKELKVGTGSVTAGKSPVMEYTKE